MDSLHALWDRVIGVSCFVFSNEFPPVQEILKNKLSCILKTNKEKTLSIVVRGRVKVSLSSCTLGMKLPHHRPGCGARKMVAHNPYCIDIQEWDGKMLSIYSPTQILRYTLHTKRRRQKFSELLRNKLTNIVQREGRQFVSREKILFRNCSYEQQ